jgi:hypothetical protein
MSALKEEKKDGGLSLQQFENILDSKVNDNPKIA